MSTHGTYVKTEVVGTSEKSMSDAIDHAIAAKSLRYEPKGWHRQSDEVELGRRDMAAEAFARR